MDTKGEDKNSWFKNINKSDTGTQIYIIPVLSKTDQVVITSSSNYSNNPVMNATDNNPQTKWVSNYEMKAYKDNFYTNRNISTGSYSRGKIVDDGKNQKIITENQYNIDLLRNQINSLTNKRNKEVDENNKRKYKLEPPLSTSNFTTKSYIHIGASNSNIKQVPLNDNNLNVVSQNIGNHYGDRFNIYIVNYLFVRRTDSRGGWGDHTLGTLLINGNGVDQYVYIGRSNTNTKIIALPDNKMKVKSNNLGNSAGDRFTIYTQNYLIVKRLDSGGGWGDSGLQAQVFKLDNEAYQKYVTDRTSKISQNNRIDEIIKGIDRDTNTQIEAINKQLAENPKIDMNQLTVNITDDGKYTGDTKTTLINNSVVKGEWIDVNVPDTITINRYELLPGRRDDNIEQLTPFPRDFYLLGSNEKDKWKILDSHFNYNPTYSDNNTPILFNIENKKRYKYIRLVISSLNPAYTGFKGLGSVSLSIFNLSGNQCYSLNKTSCETFQSYINNTNMSNIEGLTMMNENINVLADLKKFNEKYSKYIKCSDITLPDNIKQHCTAEDRNIQTVNNAYSQLMDNGSIQSLQSSTLNQYSSTTEYENMKTSVLKTHSEIVPLRQELDTKLKSLMGDKASITTDYQNRYDSTMSTSLVLSVILTSSLYFIFKGL